MSQTPDDPRNTHCPRCKFTNLKALQHLNKVAKERAASAEEAYNSGRKQEARIHSQRKKALYNLKRVILGEFVENSCLDKIRVHEINGRTYYCLYVGEFSFHSPISEWDEPLKTASESVRNLTSFNSDPSNRSSDMPTRKALKHLTEAFESPNHHIESPFVDNNYGGTFVGWSYLPGSLEEGDRVPDHYLHDHNCESDFIFEISDTFQTGKGSCEIVDRYHVYLTPWMDRSPLRQRPVYDVLLDGERKECISDRRIVDDWSILADSIANPVPNVEGRLNDSAQKAIEDLDVELDFEIGDIIELQAGTEEPPMYCRLTSVTVSSVFLFGEYEPVPPSDNAPMGLSISEIADDIIAVHEPPMQE